MFKLVDKITSFEISNKAFHVLLIGVCLCYVFVFFGEVFQPDCAGYLHCFDADRRERDLYKWNFQDDFVNDFSLRYSVTMLLLAISRDFLGSPKILTILNSVLLLCLVAFIGRDITKSRTYGLVAMLFVVFDPIFLKYDNSITYPVFWVTLFLFSVYLSLKEKMLSLVPYFGSIFLKILNALYFPIILFISNYTKKQKILYLAVIITAFALSSVYFFINNLPIIQQTKGFSTYWFLYGLGMWAFDIRSDPVLLGSIFVSLFGFIIMNKYKVEYSRKMMFCVLYFLVNPAIYSGISTFTIEPYRFLAMAVFVYIGVCMFLKNLSLIVSDLGKFGH